MTETRAQYEVGDAPPKSANWIGDGMLFTMDSSTDFIHKAFVRRFGYDCQWIEPAWSYLVAGPIKEGHDDADCLPAGL